MYKLFGFLFSFLLLVYQAKEADLLVQNKALYEDKDQLSQVGLFLVVCVNDCLWHCLCKVMFYEYSFSLCHFTVSLCLGCVVLYVQKEYIRGISAWNFNLEDLKSQAALVSIVTFLLCLIYLF